MKASPVRRLFRNRELLWCCAESLLELAACKILVTCLPFRRWSGWSGSFQGETLKESRIADLPRLRKVGRSIQLVAGWTAWESNCLDQALAAQHMLARRNLPSTLYYGMTKDENGNWLAHAWVRCGDQWVIGRRTGMEYAVVGCYAKLPR